MIFVVEYHDFSSPLWSWPAHLHLSQGLGALLAAGLGWGSAGQAGDKHRGTEGDGQPRRPLYFSGTRLLVMDKSLHTSAPEHRFGGKGVGNNTGTVPQIPPG